MPFAVERNVNTYNNTICVNQLFVISKASVNRKLLVVKFWGSQKLYYTGGWYPKPLCCSRINYIFHWELIFQILISQVWLTFPLPLMYKFIWVFRGFFFYYPFINSVRHHRHQTLCTMHCEGYRKSQI